MNKKEILDILDNAKDERGAVPMRLVRQAFDKLVQPEESTEKRTETHGVCLGTISRQAAIDLLKQMRKDGNMVPWEGKDVFARIRRLPSAQSTATWIIHKWGDDAQCSNCGQYFKDAYDMDNYDQYCRHCGAHMEGVTTT